MRFVTRLSSILSFAVLTASAGETLRTFDAIDDFTERETPDSAAFEVTGRVLSNTPSPNTSEVILADESGARLEFYRFNELSQPTPGDTIRATGLACVSKNLEPYVRIDDFTVLKHAARPEPACVRLSEITAKGHHLMTVRTEGSVIDVFPDEIDRRYLIILLKDDDVVMPVSLSLDVFGDRHDLIDARIRVTGVYRRTVGGVRKFSWPNLVPHASSDLEVLAPPPADPFALPPLEKRLYLTSEDIARMTKRTVSGTVLAIWSDDRAMIRTTDGRIVNLTFAHDAPLPVCGETIIAAGLPETDRFRINLAAVRWKRTAEQACTDEIPDEGTASVFWSDQKSRSINAEIHGRLLAVRGVVRTLPSPGDNDLRFILDTGDLAIPVDTTSTPAALNGLRIGCSIRVTGRCLLLADSEGPFYRSSRIRGLALVVRAASDIVILDRPSWWTPLRLLAVISVLLITLVAVYIWNRTLRRLADRRGRALYREQVAHAIAEFKTDERTRLAVELHDSLSQTLAGVACHLAVGDTNVEKDATTAKAYLATARKMLTSCRTELRQCLFDLRSDTLEEPDFAVAVRKTLAQLECDATVIVRFNVPRSRLKDTTAHAILAIVRELTGNAIRHGGATEVKVAGALEPDRLLFSVRDNGCGFDPASCDGPAQGHFGLEGIRNRIEKLSGAFTIDSRPGTGTKAVVSIPLPQMKSGKR